jgi:PleD family two-component response regulator
VTDQLGQPAVRVLIADDQKLVREGLVSLMGLLPGISVVGAATDGDDAVRQAAELRPDVVLMDLNMPHCNGVEATSAAPPPASYRGGGTHHLEGARVGDVIPVDVRGLRGS